LGICPEINALCDREEDRSGMSDKNRDDLKAKVFSAKDLIACQEGAIASKMIINKPAGNITIFSFDENEGLSEHTAPYDAMVLDIGRKMRSHSVGRDASDEAG
jgi:hypothetical protein